MLAADLCGLGAAGVNCEDAELEGGFGEVGEVEPLAGALEVGGEFLLDDVVEEDGVGLEEVDDGREGRLEF